MTVEQLKQHIARAIFLDNGNELEDRLFNLFNR